MRRDLIVDLDNLIKNFKGFYVVVIVEIEEEYNVKFVGLRVGEIFRVIVFE